MLDLTISLAASLFLGVSGVASQPIIGGAATHTDPAVVGLATKSGTLYCTGTLVSPRIIVTAAHCVYGIGPPARVYLGTDPERDGTFLPVDTAVAHPDYPTEGGTTDIAVVVLARPVPISPVSMVDREPSVDDRERGVHLLGFGDTDPAGVGAGVIGVKYETTVALAGVDAHWLMFGVGACHGDSGGPALVADDAGAERLAGVISRGDPQCEVGGYAARLDLYRDWVDAWIAALDPPSCRLDNRCVESCDDPDCAVGDEMSSGSPATGCAADHRGGWAIGLFAFGLVVRRRRS